MHYARAILQGEEVQAEWTAMTVPLAAPAVDNMHAQIKQHGDQFVLRRRRPADSAGRRRQLPSAPYCGS